MPRYFAFLRAINVGGHNVKMEALRGLFEDLGFANVETFIASGNVIFETRAKNAAALEKKIEARLQAALGYAVAAFLRAPAELAQAAARQPFPGGVGEADSLGIAFVHTPPAPQAVGKLLAHASPMDEFAVRGREVYWLCYGKISQSDFSGAKMEKALGQPATMRFVSTLNKLVEKYGDP